MGLPHIVPGMNHEIEFPAWSHLDFLWGIDAAEYVFSPMLENMATCQTTECRSSSN